MYRSGKTYGHERGLSCAFRQHKAESHCRLLHGYALSVHIEFEASELDHRNWVIDFGDMGAIKDWLDDMFDHVVVIAQDDPNGVELSCLEDFGLARVRFTEAVGCEAFAQEIGTYVSRWLVENDHAPRVRLHHVKVREHGANSATYMPRYNKYGIEE